MLTVDCYDGPGRGIPLTSTSIYGRFWAASHIIRMSQLIFPKSGCHVLSQAKAEQMSRRMG